MKPGAVVVVNFQGAISFKRRPAVVVSSESYNAERPDVILALITSQTGKASASTDCVLKDWKAAGLDLPSAVRMYLQTYPVEKCREIGVLSDADWAEVKDRVKRSIAS